MMSFPAFSLLLVQTVDEKWRAIDLFIIIIKYTYFLMLKQHFTHSHIVLTTRK